MNCKSCFIYLGLTLFLGACQDVIPEDSVRMERQNMSRAYNKNLIAIRNYLNQVRPAATRVGEVDIIPYVVNGDTVMYVANYEEGWEAFSNDNRLPMILMRSESGSFNPYFLDRSNPFECYFENAGKSMQAIGIENTESPDGMWQLYSSSPTNPNPGNSQQYMMVGTAYEVSSITYTPKGGRISTKWKQSYPYNQFTPYYTDGSGLNSLVGCGAVATGQFMYFYQRYFNHSMTTVTNADYDSSKNVFTFSGDSNSVWNLFDDGSDKEMVNNADRIKPTAVFLGYVAKNVCHLFGASEGKGTQSYWTDCLEFINSKCNLSLKCIPFNYDKLIGILSSGLPSYAVSYGTQLLSSGATNAVGHDYLIDFAESEYVDTYEVYAYVSLDATKPEINPTDPILNPYGPSLDYYRSKYGNIDYNRTHTEYNKWIKMNWGWGGESDEILINSQLSNWITYKGSTTLNFSNNRIAVIK